MAERHIGVALDLSASSIYALQWALDNLSRDGDTLVLVFVNNASEEDGNYHLWSPHGAPLIPFREFTDPAVLTNYGLAGSNVEEIITKMEKATESKKIQVLAKSYWGDPRVKLLEAILELPIDALVMGSRGLGTIKRVFLGSVSNYVVNNAPCPVTAVKLPDSTL